MSLGLTYLLMVALSSIMTLWSRRVSLVNKDIFFTTGLINYLVVACVGIVACLVHFNYNLPDLPSGNIKYYLLAVGIFIPLSWLAQYKIVSLVGAANGAIAATINYTTAALFGFIFLSEELTISFIIGSILISWATYLSLTTSADTKSKKQEASLLFKIFLISSASLFLALGLLFEKEAIILLEYWNYLFYGWTMQFIGASFIWLILGRRELKRVTLKKLLYALSLGIVVVCSGLVFVYALSRESLSTTVMVTSVKITLTMLLAAIFLKERNNLNKRLLALFLAVSGLIILLW